VSTKPHDRLVKHTFGDPRHAAGELRLVLPAALTARIDWQTLALEPGSFVDAELGERHCDLLYRAAVDGRTALIYLLFEHQSEADPLMPLRLLRYVLRVWDRWLSSHKKAQKLPAVLSLVLHSGSRPWSAPSELLQLIDLDGELLQAAAPYLPGLRFLLDDLAGATSGELQRRRELTALARLTQGALRHLDGGEPLGFLRSFAALLREVAAGAGGVGDLAAVAYYIRVRVEMTHREEVVAFMQEHLGERGREAFVSIADGDRAEGEARGRAEGEAKGRVQKAAESVLAVLEARGIEIASPVRERIIGCGDIGTLDHWLRRAVAAAKAEDIFDT
jgi:predicted transposase YdaD